MLFLAVLLSVMVTREDLTTDKESGTIDGRTSSIGSSSTHTNQYMTSEEMIEFTTNSINELTTTQTELYMTTTEQNVHSNQNLVIIILMSISFIITISISSYLIVMCYKKKNMNRLAHLELICQNSSYFESEL